MGEYVYFHWADYAIFIAFLVLFTLIGVVVSWLDRKKTSAKYFLTGGGQSHWMMVALSMQASFLSAIFILSGPGEIYNYGTAYVYVCLPTFFAIPIATRLYLPVYYRLNLISAYEYLEKRYNRIVRLMASALFSLQIILYLAVVLYAPSLALSQATGYSIFLAIIFCGIICTTYTCLGGMKATIWNDTIQMLIIYLGLIVVIVKGVIEVGGVSEVLKRNQDGGRIIFNEFRIDPTLRTTFWTQMIGGFFLFLAPYTTNQAIIQKVIGSKTLNLANKALYFCMVSNVAICLLVVLFGMMIYAHYHDCDPITSGRIDKIDQIVPLLIIELLRNQPGLPGLFMASTFSAALSSMSGCLNALSAVLLADFILPAYAQKYGVMSERFRVHLSRCFVLIFGLLVTFLSYQAHFLGESVMQLSLCLMSSTCGPVLAIVTMGMFFKRTNHLGAGIGFLVGLFVGVWIAFGAIYHDVTYPILPTRMDGCPSNNTIGIHFDTPHYAYEESTTEKTSQEPMFVYKIAYFYYSVIGSAITFVVGLLVSVLTGEPKDLDPNLFYKRKTSIQLEGKKDLELDNKIFLEKSLGWDGETMKIGDLNEPLNIDLNGKCDADHKADHKADHRC